MGQSITNKKSDHPQLLKLNQIIKRKYIESDQKLTLCSYK